jgi:outer membrane protein OmpA-like peptidoglycan-associated protein/tetratricopeptide (TPR) repeat protein
MMKKTGIIIIVLCQFVVIPLFSQSYKEYRGDVFFNRFNYSKAIEYYLEVMAKEPTNNFVMKKLAESYKYLGIDTASVNWYNLFIKTGKYEPQDLYNYSIVLKNTGQYDRAGQILQQYQQQKQEDKYLLNKQFTDGLRLDTFRFKVTLIEQSSPEADFSPAFFGNKIIFVSSRQGVGIFDKKYERDGEAFLQLYVADTLPDGQLTNIVPFDSRFNSRFHEGPVSFCPHDSTMYFTRDNYKILFKGMSRDGQVKLKIYKSKFTYNEWLKYIQDAMDSIGIKTKLESDDWRMIKDFPYNNNEYSVGHPSISADGRSIYFVSDMPGGKGGTDLYMCTRIGRNEWSEPVNLVELNTEGNEMFPFIHPSGVLFFASDGWPGLGKLDIFKAMPRFDLFEKPQNMGAPLNSQDDDFGLIADDQTKTGYFSSNRPGGKGGDDLYYVVFNNKVNLVLAGKISEKGTGITIPGVNIRLTDEETNELASVQTNEKGYFYQTVNLTKNIRLDAIKSYYLPLNAQIEPKSLRRSGDTLYYSAELDYYGIYGSVFIKGTNEKVPFVDIVISSKNGSEKITLRSDSIGNFRTLLDANTDYEISFNKKDFFNLRAEYSTKANTTGYINVNEFIELGIEKIEVNKTIEIPNIYYDLGKWAIRPDAAVELDKVVKFMEDNPTLQIELGSHTDARGNSNSNETLSQKRAESAVNYIVSKRIDKQRIVAKGYGESKLKNGCKDGVKCSEEEHQQNRRTEIRVTSF